MKTPRILSLFALFCTLSLVNEACTSGSSFVPINWIIDGSDLRKEVLSSLASTVIIPRYQKLKESAELLNQKVEQLCETPSMENLTVVKDQWNEVRDLWKSSEVVRFGPYDDLPLRVGPKIDFWPPRPDKIEDLLEGTEIITPSLLDSMGTTVRGLPVSEYLLYGPQSDQLLESEHRRCAFLSANTLDLVSNVDTFIQAWTPLENTADDFPSFGWEFVNSGTDKSRYYDPHKAVNEVVSRMILTVEDIRVLKLGKPLGDSSGGNPLFDRLESPYALRSIQDSVQALKGIYPFFYGEFDGNKGQGVLDLLRGEHPEMIERFEQSYQAGLASLLAIESSLKTAIVDHRDQVENAQDVLRELQVVLQIELAQVLNVNPGFNDNDGD
jgi:predicted lipoprotein